MDKKRVIKGVMKTTGKYTLKGIGKGLELASRGTIKTVKALVKNRSVQKILTGAGVLAACVAVPTIATSAITVVALKYMLDRGILDNNKSLINEINDVLNVGNKVTNFVGRKVVSPALDTADKGVKKLYLVSRTEKEESDYDDSRVEYTTYEKIKDIKGEILVNTTPVGMYPKTGVSPVQEDVISNFHTLIDIIYNPRIESIPKILETPWIKCDKESYPPYKFEIEMIRNKKFDPNVLENIIDYYKN